MKKYLITLGITALIISCSNKKDYRFQVKSSNENVPDSAISFSDQGIRIAVSWKSGKPKNGNAILFDGANNTVLTLNYPGIMEELTSDTAHLIHYEFNEKDKAGTWRLVMNFDNEEIVNHTFEVSGQKTDPYAYTSVDCYQANGKVDIANFYQLSAIEREMIDLQVNTEFDLLPSLRYQLEKRATLCFATELSSETMHEWTRYYEKLSGVKMRQSQPTAHERILEVMPVFEEEYLHVNTDFIEWFVQNLVPDPANEQMNGYAFQYIYNQLLQEKVRSLALVGLYYRSLPNSGLEAHVEYAKITATRHIEDERVILRDRYVDVMEYLIRAYHDDCHEWMRSTVFRSEQDEAPQPFDAINMGFWIRRGMDGSDYSLWMALRQVLEKYDQQWYNDYIQPHWAP